MLRVTTRALAVGLLYLMVAASGRDRLQAAGEPGREGPKVATAGQLKISEFRLRGPNGANDEFIEIYNHSGSNHTVAALSGTGYGVAASDGVTRCSIPNGTIIPNRGHYLCVNSNGYSLGSYPAGNGTTATGDATYTTDIPDNAGIALFNNNTGGGSYVLANRLDAVGSTSEVNTLYREGAGYPPLSALFNIDASMTRRPLGGCTGSSGGGNCASALLMETTPGPGFNQLVEFDDNQVDFIFVDTSGTSAGAGQRLGAPGPENLSSPIALDTTSGSSGQLKWSRLDACKATLASPNKIRELTSDPANNSTFGTYDLRRTWSNNTGMSLTRLRFRVVDVSTFPSASGVADFRPRTSTDLSVSVDRPPCGSGTSNVTVRGTTIEQPPSQPNGSGYNGTLSVGAVTAGTPLANGASIDVRFLLGVQQTGIGRFCVVPETLPASIGQTLCFIGSTDADIAAQDGDYDYDQRSDLQLFNPATGLLRILKSAGGAFAGTQSASFGSPSLTPVHGDYDGDGRFDYAAYQRTTGFWVMLLSADGYSRVVGFFWGGPGFDTMPGDYDGDGITDLAVYNSSTGYWNILTSTSAFTSSLAISWGGPGYTGVPGQDVDGDGRSDLVVYNERLGTWYALKSSTNFTTALTQGWGGPGYTLVPGDYDGDGKTDFGLYARATGYWYVLTSSSGYASSTVVSFGGPGFVPVPGDYDGDRKMDIGIYQLATRTFLALTSSTAYSAGSAIVRVFGAGESAFTSAIVPANSREIDGGDADGDFTSDLTVYETTTGLWSTLHSTGGFTSATNIGWGGTGYTAAPGDYDGDGRRDLGLYQESTGNWLVLLSSTNFTTTLTKSAGGVGYLPVQGDYDGDGKTDFAVYQASTGLWSALTSSTNYTTTIAISWGGGTFVARPGDFDGDGKQDLSVYDTTTGNWAILTSSSNYTSSIARNFGGAGYAPVPADFDGDGITDFAVYQSSTGVWSMLKSTSGNALGATVPYGGAGYTPVAGDWDGDRCADIGVYTSAGAWSILLSSSGYRTSLSKSWGGAGYAPVPTFP